MSSGGRVAKTTKPPEPSGFAISSEGGHIDCASQCSPPMETAANGPSLAVTTVYPGRGGDQGEEETRRESMRQGEWTPGLTS
jgi:hypothetical protein